MIFRVNKDCCYLAACGTAQLQNGLGFPSGINPTLAFSARAQDIRVCVEQVSRLQQSTLYGARSDSKLRWKHKNVKNTNVNPVDGKSSVKRQREYILEEVQFMRPIYKGTLASESFTKKHCVLSDLPTELEALRESPE